MSEPKKEKYFKPVEEMSPQEKVWIIHRSCIEKKSFKLEAVNKVIDKLMEQGTIMYYYHCPLCSSYHLTKNPPYFIDFQVA